MLNVAVTGGPVALREDTATLWHCSQCQTFIAIRSVYVPDEAFCPICLEVPLDFFSSFTNITGLQFGEA